MAVWKETQTGNPDGRLAGKSLFNASGALPGTYDARPGHGMGQDRKAMEWMRRMALRGRSAGRGFCLSTGAALDQCQAHERGSAPLHILNETGRALHSWLGITALDLVGRDGSLLCGDDPVTP